MTGAEGSSKLDASCLVEPDPTRQTISLQMCGNGIVETGEDCDPGMGTTSNCCDSATCKFVSGAICDPQSSACCTDQCGFAPATQVCRPSRDALCDTAETCTGNSSACPADVVAKNGAYMPLGFCYVADFSSRVIKGRAVEVTAWHVPVASAPRSHVCLVCFYFLSGRELMTSHKCNVRLSALRWGCKRPVQIKMTKHARSHVKTQRIQGRVSD